jgi:hypothetical protein
MIEYGDVAERKQALAQLIDIENKVWMQVEGHPPVQAIADEDLDRANDEKTSAVHFMRFEFTPAMVADAKQGAALAMGIDHPHYQTQLNPLPAHIRDALTADFD